MSKISVIITTYNLEAYIESCLDELLNQSFQDFDILLVDDCSKDSTQSAVDAYKERFLGRLETIYLKQNLGSPALTRNAALNSGKISGKFLVFLDGDDSIEPDFLEKLYQTAIQQNAEVVLCAYDRIEEETKKVLCTEMKQFPPIISLPVSDDTVAFINGSLWNKMFSVRAIGELRIPNFKVGEDFSFQQKIFQNCTKIACIDQVLIHYRVRKNSVISNTQEDTIHQFAAEFIKNENTCSDPNYKSIIALSAFIHIGISMAIRAYDNDHINIRQHLKWTRHYFKENFSLFQKSKFLKLSSLKSHGIKGYAIWGCKVLYKLNCFRCFLIAYRMVTQLFHVDFKF